MKCQLQPITFSFVSGEQNPADCISRTVSFKQLCKSNYIKGPTFLCNKNFNNQCLAREKLMEFTVPNPLIENVNVCSDEVNCNDMEHLIPVNKFSSFWKLIRVHRLIYVFINNIKLKLSNKKSKLQDNFEENFFHKTISRLIYIEQNKYYGEVFKYFNSSTKKIKDIPQIVNQLNLYIDQNSLIRVKSKFENYKKLESKFNFPILMHKDSELSFLIIKQIHSDLCHSGLYNTVSEVRKIIIFLHVFHLLKRY